MSPRIVAIGFSALFIALVPCRAEEELRCVYSVTEQTDVWPPAENQPFVRKNVEPRRETHSYTMTLGLSSDGFSLVEEQNPESVVYVFRARRIYTLHHDSKTYEDDSLFADLAFRVHELTQRLALGAGLRDPNHPEAPGAPPSKEQGVRSHRFLERFSSETLFSLRLPIGPQEAARSAIEAKQNGSTWEFAHDGDVVAQLIPAAQTFPTAYRRSLMHFLAYTCQIHPEIRNRIVALGALPGTLSFKSVEALSERTTTYKLNTTNVSQDVWKGIPPGYSRQVDRLRPLDRILQRLDARRAAMPPATRETLNAFVDEALARGSILDASLAWLEHHARTGDCADEVQTRIKNTRGEQPQLLDPARTATQEGTERALKELDAIDRSGLKKGYMLDALGGTFLSMLGRLPEADERFGKALEANPFLVNVYVQLGDNFYRSFEMVPAWRCYDAARVIDPRSPHLDAVRILEARFEQDFPENF